MNTKHVDVLSSDEKAVNSVSSFKYKTIHMPSVLIIIYACSAHLSGLFLLVKHDDGSTTASSIYIFFRFFIAFILLSHSLILSAYLFHESLHGNIFKGNFIINLNFAFATILGWINGACYWPCRMLARQHHEHHRVPVDYDCSSNCPFMSWLKKSSSMQRKLLELCEYYYIPLHFYVYSWRAIYRTIYYIEPYILREMFKKKQSYEIIDLNNWPRNKRNIQIKHLFRTFTVMLVRILMFYYLTRHSYYHSGILVYCSAYNTMIIVTRFTDCFSHSYKVVLLDTKTAQDKSYEQSHTYSIRLFGPKWFQNVCETCLFLNFNYHNEHHLNPRTVWSRLNLVYVDKQKTRNFPDPRLMHLDFLELLKQYHTHRVSRLFIRQYGAPAWDEETHKWNTAKFIGIVDASFLVLEI